jgi:transposase
MSHPLQISVKETINELRALQRKQGSLISKRLLMLIEIKKAAEKGLSKRELSHITGINHNSIVKWRTVYNTSGIEPLLVHGRKGGFRKSIFSKENHDKLEAKLNDPQNGIRGYVELLAWIKLELCMDVKYITLIKYCQRHFGSKIKVARKSHVQKDDEAVETFKKTSH